VLKKIRGKAILNSKIDKTSYIGAGSQLLNSNIGKFSFCGYDCSIIDTSIGSFCSIASRVSIGAASHPLNWISTSPAFYLGGEHIPKKYAKFTYKEIKHTIIENDVWIGEGVFIKAGVNIESGAVIGSGSVVTKSVGAYEIWAGNPAKMIRKRFSENIIDELMKVKWWDFSEEDIDKYSKYFNSPENFIKEVYKQ
jgi:acetyltransferase-like isoleucine patch superfamily enzyme